MGRDITSGARRKLNNGRKTEGRLGLTPVHVRFALLAPSGSHTSTIWESGTGYDFSCGRFMTNQCNITNILFLPLECRNHSYGRCVDFCVGHCHSLLPFACDCLDFPPPGKNKSKRERKTNQLALLILPNLDQFNEIGPHYPVSILASLAIQA